MMDSSRLSGCLVTANRHFKQLWMCCFTETRLHSDTVTLQGNSLLTGWQSRCLVPLGPTSGKICKHPVISFYQKWAAGVKKKKCPQIDKKQLNEPYWQRFKDLLNLFYYNTTTSKGSTGCCSILLWGFKSIEDQESMKKDAVQHLTHYKQ